MNRFLVKNKITTYRKPLINVTSISTVELFVTMARLAQGQTSVITVKIGAHNAKIYPASENSSRFSEK